MYFIKLDAMETIERLCRICTKYKDDFDIDIEYGRYTVDGCSILGVSSLMGNIVRIHPPSEDRNSNTELIKNMYSELKKIGAYEV